MSSYRRKLITAVSATVAAAALAVTGISAASAASAASGAEHMQAITTSTTSSTASVIAYGVFTEAGRVNLSSSKVSKFVFSNGTITVTHKKTGGSQHFNSKTCLAMISETGTYKMTGGTGSYAGIKGSGTYALSVLFLGPKVSGKCSTTKRPLAQHEILATSGTVSK
jgi:hypothetical protein